jgi:polysaccharide biosynthesis transport protein
MNALAQNTAPMPLMLTVQPNTGLALVTTPQAAAARPARTIALEDIVRCIIARWKSGLFFALLASAAVFLFMTGKVPQYAAEASIVMRINDDKVFNFDKVVNNNGESHSAPFMLNNHRVQLKSRRFLEYFCTSLTPQERAVFLAPPAKTPLATRLMEKLRSAPPPSTLSPEEQEREDFIAMLEPSTVDFIKETYILRITARHHDAATAAQLANAWVRAYIDYVGREENATALHATAFLRQQSEDLRKKVIEAEQKLAEYRSDKGLVETGAEKPADSEKLKLLSTELAKAELEHSRVQESLRQIEVSGGDVEKLLSVEVLAQSPAVSALRPDVTAKLREKELIDAEYGPKHPAHAAFYREYEVLRSEVSAAIRRSISEVQNKSQSLAAQVETVKEQIAAANGTVLAQGKDGVEFNMLKGQLESDRALYEKILSRLNEASVSTAFNEVTYLRPSEKAVAPEKPASPNKPMSVILAGFSFAAVFVMVPLLLAFSAALRKSGLAAIFGEKALAPSAASIAQPAPSGFSTMPQTPAAPAHPDSIGSMEVLAAIPSLTPPAEGRVDQMLAGLFRSDNAARSAFETIAARITACAQPGKNVVLVTSRTAGEGKSFTAAALGVACLAHGKSALIIDASLRRPALHQWLPRQTSGASIWDIVASDGRLHLDLQALRCGGSNLFTLQAGGASSAPAAAFSKPWFPGLMKFLTDRVDIVILDAPSLDEEPEISLLAAAAHQSLIVCNKAISDSAAVLAAAAKLHTALPELNLAGCLLNDGPLPTGAAIV